MTLSLLDRSSVIALRHTTNVPRLSFLVFTIGHVLRDLAYTSCANVFAFAPFCSPIYTAAGFDVPGTDVLEPIRGVKFETIGTSDTDCASALWAMLRQA